MMNWLLRLLSFGMPGMHEFSTRTLEAAYQRQSAALQEARRAAVELLAAEKQLSATAESLTTAGWLGARIADLRTQRLRLESSAEKLRLRIELFRSEKLAVGARYVAARAASRSGETLGMLAREVAEVTKMVERAKETLAELQTEARG